jgi:hypothetical protein
MKIKNKLIKVFRYSCFLFVTALGLVSIIGTGGGGGGSGEGSGPNALDLSGRRIGDGNMAIEYHGEPNDPLLPTQFGIWNTEADRAWDIETGDP